MILETEILISKGIIITSYTRIACWYPRIDRTEENI